jgi:hypothetical protein
MEGQNTIIHEGGDSYRPLIIIPINNPNLWTNNNIAYFRSSGRSNSTPQYSNTWFPLGGIVEQNNTKILRETFNTGHIIKMSDLLEKKDSNWKTNLCMEYFHPLENQSFENKSFDKILSTLNPNSTNIDAIEALFTEALLIKKFLDSYFFFDWQLRISAQIGGGFWDRNPNFCTFVLGLNRIPVINVPRMPDYFKEAEGDLARYVQGDVEGDNGLNNNDYMINFLKQNQSQLALPDGLADLQTLEKNENIKIIPNQQTKIDYENAIIRANGRIAEIKRTIALLARMKLGSKKNDTQNNITQVNTPLKQDDVIVPKNKKAKIEPNENNLETKINTNEPVETTSTRSTRMTRQTGLTDETDNKKRKRGGKTIKRKGKPIKRRSKTIKKRRKNTKKKKK